MSIDPTTLVSDIYEASFLPELWPDILQNIANLAKCVGGVLFSQSRNEVKWTASPEIVPVMTDFLVEGWNVNNTRAERTLSKQYAGFLNDLDIFTEEELSTEPSYVNFYRPRGLGWGAGTVIVVPSGDVLVVSIERRLEGGPVSRETLGLLDGLRPHLARAAMTSARLGLERARGMVSALKALGLPAAVITAGSRILAANSLLENMSSQVRLLAFDRIAFVQRKVQVNFENSLVRLKGSSTSTLSFAMAATALNPPTVAHLIPLRKKAHDIFGSGDAVLVLTPLNTPNLIQADILAGLFDLTPAEARIARLVCGGQTAEAIAATLGLSPETIRTQSKAVLAKVGVKRQVELAALISSVRLPVQDSDG